MVLVLVASCGAQCSSKFNMVVAFGNFLKYIANLTLLAFILVNNIHVLIYVCLLIISNLIFSHKYIHFIFPVDPISLSNIYMISDRSPVDLHFARRRSGKL